jgi:hypothetical protein
VARIQILELPDIVEGESVTTPFVLVVDQLDTDDVRDYQGDVVLSRGEQVDSDALKAATGAAGVIVHPGTLDVA